MSPTPNDWAKYKVAKSSSRPASLIERADQLIDIREIYRQMGNYPIPDGPIGSWKIDCPFAAEHSDGGLDKNTRFYYETNSIYCWAAHGFLTTTALYARWKGLPQKRAAEILLEERGLLRVKNYRERWNELVARSEDHTEALGEPSEAVKALQTTLEADAAYKSVEYAPAVREAWRAVLTALDILWQRPDTDLAKVTNWYEKSLKKINSAVSDAVLSEKENP